MLTLLRRFSSWCKQDPAKASFTLVVLGTHAFFMFTLFIFPSLHLPKRSSQKLVVKTYQMQPKPLVQNKKSGTIATSSKPPKAAAPVSSAAIKKNPVPTPKTAPPVAKKETAPAKKKETTPTTTVPAKKKEPVATTKKPAPKPKGAPPLNVSKELLQELEERIAKIEPKRDKLYQRSEASSSKGMDHARKEPASRGPVLEDTLATPAPFYAVGDELAEYADFLVSYLHQNLHLPDFGEVKIQITLKKDGTVEKLVVLKTESEKNKKYLEESLPRLQFPEFRGLVANKKQQTFVLTFCNEL